MIIQRIESDYLQIARSAIAAYNVGEYTEIHGPVEPDLLRTAVRRVVDATETLRSRFAAADDAMMACM